MYIFWFYMLMSVVIGVIDLSRIYNQGKYLDSFPIGDIGTFIEPKKILGIHNWIFLPSWLLIIVVLVISRCIDRMF